VSKIPITPSALPGTMEKATKVGTWSAKKPIIDSDKCTGCFHCWFFCPDSAITRYRGKIKVRLELCKGCGICATECPEEAILWRDSDYV